MNYWYESSNHPESIDNRGYYCSSYENKYLGDFQNFESAFVNMQYCNFFDYINYFENQKDRFDNIPFNFLENNSNFDFDETITRTPKSLNSEHSECKNTESLYSIEWSGVLQEIPKVKSLNLYASEYAPIANELFLKGYDIRLGEAGRCQLKRTISKNLRRKPDLRKSCIEKCGHLKKANVQKLIFMAEISGCLMFALEICADYWRNCKRKKLGLNKIKLNV